MTTLQSSLSLNFQNNQNSQTTGILLPQLASYFIVLRWKEEVSVGQVSLSPDEAWMMIFFFLVECNNMTALLRSGKSYKTCWFEIWQADGWYHTEGRVADRWINRLTVNKSIKRQNRVFSPLQCTGSKNKVFKKSGQSDYSTLQLQFVLLILDPWSKSKSSMYYSNCMFLLQTFI